MRTEDDTRQAGLGSLDPYRVVGVAVAFSVLFTAGVTFIPFVRFAYRSPPLHVAFDITVGMIALLAGYLLYGRYALTRSLRDLVLTASLLVLGPTNLFFSTLPIIALGEREHIYVWAAAGGRIVAAVLLALAPFIADRKLEMRRRFSIWVLIGLAVVAPLIAAAIFGVLGLDPGIPAALSPSSSNRPLLVGHPLLLGVQLTAAILYGAAAVGLLRRARETHDELLVWLAAGAAVSAFARLNYFLFPSIYSEWVYAGDVLRVGANVLFLIGATREIRNYWRRLGQLAATEERRRLARDLHDGLAQELALIVSYAQVLDDPDAVQGRDPRVEILSASQRALRQSRAAISALSERRAEELHIAIAKAAEEAADRLDSGVSLSLQPGISLSLAATEMMSRVTGEAVANAGRHAQAKAIHVSLVRAQGRVVLRIEDDGIGFDGAEVARSPGFGLVSMRERAEQLGADYRLTSSPGIGTMIEVSIAP